MQSPTSIPEHIAIIMDGNGRWAKARHLPRTAGHQAGQKALRNTLEYCVKKGIKVLSVFAFSSENWQRPADEVKKLMDLFLRALNKEVPALHKNGVKIHFIGQLDAFSDELRSKMTASQDLTRHNQTLLVNVAVNYGGRWDLLQAARKLAVQLNREELDPEQLQETDLADCLSTAGSSDPDLLIRTGNEQRISNFLLWQCAYSELFFSPVLWPDFDDAALDQALMAYQSRQRRFGKTQEQMKAS